MVAIVIAWLSCLSNGGPVVGDVVGIWVQLCVGDDVWDRFGDGAEVGSTKEIVGDSVMLKSWNVGATVGDIVGASLPSLPPLSGFRLLLRLRFLFGCGVGAGGNVKRVGQGVLDLDLGQPSKT